MMRHAGSFAVTMLLAALPLYACAGSTAIEDDAGPTTDGGTTQPMSGATLRASVRDAFVAEAEWMRVYGAATLEGGADAQAAFNRLNATEAQIVQEVVPFAGDARATELGKLLHARANAFADAVASMRSKGASQTNDPQTALDANAKQIADFFATLCPGAFPGNGGDYLQTADRSMIAGLEARASGDDATAIADFDAAQVSNVFFADAVGDGLASTFDAQLAPSTSSRIEEALALKLHMLLGDQAFWMRAYVVDQMKNRSAQPELDRAVKATIDMGEVFTSYFGQQVGTQMQFYVHQDTVDAIAFLYAMEQNDQGAVDALSKKWDFDADTLAQYLSEVSLTFDLESLQRLLRTNVDRERAMIEARASSQWDAEATDYEMVLVNRDTLANNLATAITATFPRVH